MSLNISYTEAMGISKTNPHSQFILSSSRKHVKLMPKHLGNIKAGIVEQLDAQIFVYSNELGGVPVAYQNIRLVQNMGRIIADQTCIHLDIIADFVLFKPQIGCTLIGVINKVGKQHIGCLVHGKFNAWIPRLNPGGQNEELVGEEIQFVVTNIFTNNNILSLKGRVEESSFIALKKRKKKNVHTVFDNTDSLADDSNIVTLSQFKTGAALSSTRIDERSPEQPKKKKRKKDKCSFDGSVNEIGPGTSIDDKTDEEPKKKKKKSKHSLEEPNPKTVSVEKTMESTLGASSDRKRKISGHDLSDTRSEIVAKANFDEINSGSSKKKKRKKEKHSFEGSLPGDNKETNECEIPIKKKKKKHRQSLDLSESGHNLTEENTKRIESFCATQLNTTISKTGEMSSLSSENLEHSGKRSSMESDEGYHSKKSKKKHKKSLENSIT